MSFRPYFFISSAFYIPHPKKLHTGGEDSHFISTDNITLGIADGVGGWASVPGANVAKFSRDLMELCNNYSNQNEPIEIIRKAYEKMQKSIIGSSTVVLAKLINTTIKFYNIGDSKCAVYREFKQVFETKTTSFSFNTPYQLGHRSKSTVDNGIIQDFDIEPEDIIVCGSDGLWDNLFNHEIEQILINSWSTISLPSGFVKHSSKRLADTAIFIGANEGKNTPFEIEARKNGHEWKGGKLDDTTVIVSQVVFNEN